MSCIELYYLIGRLNKDINKKKRTLADQKADNKGCDWMAKIDCIIIGIGGAAWGQWGQLLLFTS